MKKVKQFLAQNWLFFVYCAMYILLRKSGFIQDWMFFNWMTRREMAYGILGACVVLLGITVYLLCRSRGKSLRDWNHFIWFIAPVIYAGIISMENLVIVNRASILTVLRTLPIFFIFAGNVLLIIRVVLWVVRKQKEKRRNAVSV
jgi:hypothetical protein